MPSIEFVAVAAEGTSNALIKTPTKNATNGENKPSAKVDNVKSPAKKLDKKTQQAFNNGNLIDAVVNDLVLSKLNPRQTVTEEEIKTLEKSIRVAGCIHNLIGLDVDGKIEIVAGGRRMRALQNIVIKDKTLDRTVKVMIAQNADEAIIMAGAENHARSKPSPVDEILSYKQAVDNKATVEEIANAFGQTVRHVKSRLKLAGLSPIILEALKNKEITLDLAGAYAFSDSHEEQNKVFEDLKGNFSADNPAVVLRYFTTDLVENDSKLAAFVTREVYEKAGGAITENLFGEDVYFHDLKLLDDLVEAKKDAEVNETVKNGWKWAEFKEEPIYSYKLKGATVISAETTTLSELEEAELELLQQYIDDDNPTKNQEKRYNELVDKADEEYYPPEVMQLCGVYHWVSYDGEVRSLYGILLDEDKEPAITAGIINAPKDTEILGENEHKGEKDVYSKALVTDLITIRTAAIQTALLETPDLAFDILVFSLANKGYKHRLPVDISCNKINSNIESDEGLNISDKLLSAGINYPFDDESTMIAFDKFRKLSKTDKNRILTESVAASFQGWVSTSNHCDGMIERIADLSNSNTRNVWKPTASFFKRLRTEQLDEIVTFINGKPVSMSFVNDKKSNKVKQLHDLFNDNSKIKGFSKDKQKRIAEWLPIGLENRPISIDK